MSLRVNVGRALGRVFPQLHEYAFNRDRNREVPASRLRLRPRDTPSLSDRPPHIIVAALEGPRCGSWGPAQGNYYFEIYQSACERFGAERVSVLDIYPQGQPDWGVRLAELIRETEATHLFAHMERDPGLEVQWTWDEVWAGIAPWWDGVFIGVMWGSGFDLVRMKGRRLARMSPNLLGLDICVPIDDVLVRGRPEVGPVPLIESKATQKLLFERLKEVSKTSDLSFIGALYPYRQELLNRLAAQGIRVAVNPHKDLTDGNGNARPSWLDYMSALAASEMTLNFSMASSGAHQQLKWRVIEATLAGTLLVTDDKDRTSTFFTVGEDFVQLHTAEDLPSIVESWLAHPTALRAAQMCAQQHSRQIATNGLWDLVGAALNRRMLPSLPNTMRPLTARD